MMTGAWLVTRGVACAGCVSLGVLSSPAHMPGVEKELNDGERGVEAKRPWGATLGSTPSLGQGVDRTVQRGIRSQTSGKAGPRGPWSGPGSLGCVGSGPIPHRRRPRPTTCAGLMSVSDADVERIAARVAELVGSATRAEQEWVTADVIAKSFGVSRSWVYANADALGALRIGRGQNGRIRFDPRLVRERIQSIGSPSPSPGRRRSKRARRSDGADLLAIRERPHAGRG